MYIYTSITLKIKCWSRAYWINNLFIIVTFLLKPPYYLKSGVHRKNLPVWRIHIHYAA